ncbi:Yip1 family protein [uncultured Phenylobacterium sp.]|uniref:Yip1 family protein n=1 Tax=uncultured Phenylobacterium sp. TaxID=349273 RepID=UPI0025DE53F8|nr:Yip1 family protein [uncultured Phenylobacterium sp.]
MSTPRGAGVAVRALRMLVTPSRTWDAIAAEPADARGLLPRYVAPLAAIPAICGIVGPLQFGFNIANVGVVMSPLGLVLGAVAGYLLTFVALLAAAVLVDWTGAAFGGSRDRARALELVAYAATASWIGGAAELYPSLGLAVGILAAVYCLYTLYLGITPMLGVPDERRLYAFASILLIVAGLWAVRGFMAMRAAELGGPLYVTYAAPR